jgi:hypothetical protein
MANTFELIASYAATGSVSNIEFTSIPSTYTDLVLKFSLRSSTNTATDIFLTYNGTASGYSYRLLQGNGASASSRNGSGSEIKDDSGLNLSTYTASTFSSGEAYIPNYAGSTNKSSSHDSTLETNATTSYMTLTAGLLANTAAITSVKIVPGAGNFVQYSTAYLFGIKSS